MRHNTIKTLFYRLFAVFIMLNLSCVSSVSCLHEKEPVKLLEPMIETSTKIHGDARHLSFDSFVMIGLFVGYAKDCTKEMRKTRPSECISINRSEASGVVIYRTHTSTTTAFVLTAGHMCEQRLPDESKRDRYITHLFGAHDIRGNGMDAEFFSEFNNVDACILQLHNAPETLKAIPIASMMPKLGEKIYNISAADSMFDKGSVLVFEGFYSGDMSKRGYGEVFTVPATQGSSGSPVMNADGELVSMLHSVKLNKKQLQSVNISFGINLKHIVSAVTMLQSLDGIPSGYEIFKRMTSSSTTTTSTAPDAL